MGNDKRIDANPYRSPAEVAVKDAEDELQQPTLWNPLAFWPVIFALNLPLPIIFGLNMTDAGGRWGMLVAIGVLLVLGSGVCIGHRKAGTALIAGGVIVSLTQIFPLPHIVAGMIGLELADKAGMIDDAVKLPSILGGFVVTFVTGGLLIALAGAIGAIVHLVRDWSRSE